MTFAAKYNADGTVTAGPFADGTTWDSIPPNSRFWDELMSLTNNGASISAYVQPNPIPSPVSRRQFFQQAAVASIITQNEALAAVTTGALPAVISSFIATLPTDQQFGAKMLFAAQDFQRSSPLANAFGQTIGMTPDQIDAFFVAASKL